LIFGAQFGFDFGPNTRFEVRAFTTLGFLAFAFGALRAQSCLKFCLAARLFLRLLASGRFGLKASLDFGAKRGLLFSAAARLFRGHALSFLLSATARFCFGLSLGGFFFAATGSSLRAHLCFDLCPQAGFVFSFAARALFGLTPHVSFDAATFGVFSDPLCFLFGSGANVLTGLHAFDLFFNGAESHFGPAALFIFLGSAARVLLQIRTLFFGAAFGLLLFGFA
jgi:hypothetical protein